MTPDGPIRVRALHALRRCGWEDANTIAGLTWDQALDCRDLGIKSLRAVVEWLHEQGLRNESFEGYLQLRAVPRNVDPEGRRVDGSRRA